MEGRYEDERKDEEMEERRDREKELNSYGEILLGGEGKKSIIGGKVRMIVGKV